MLPAPLPTFKSRVTSSQPLTSIAVISGAGFFGFRAEVAGFGQAARSISLSGAVMLFGGGGG